MRYTNMPRNGRMMMKRTQKVLDRPLRSLLRKRSLKTHHRHMNQARKMKNSNMASRNEPLSLNMCADSSGQGGAGREIRGGPQLTLFATGVSEAPAGTR